MKNRPTIGILPDFQIGSDSGYSKKDHYAIRANYVDSINDAGGVALVLTYNYQAIDKFLSLIDGLMVIGGHMDINPTRYNAENIHPTVKLNLTRENFEYEIVSKAVETSLPIFGICNGMQLISILHGGKIIQHIPDNPKFMDHEQSHFDEFKKHETPYHQVNIDTNSNFYKIVQAEKFSCNSSHHQAVESVGSNLKVVGTASDGIIEAFEKPNHPFCVGVQWHPEFHSSSIDKKLFVEFINQAIFYKKQKTNNE